MDHRYELDLEEISNNKIVRVSYNEEVDCVFGFKELDDGFYLFDNGYWKLSSEEDITNMLKKLDRKPRSTFGSDSCDNKIIIRVCYTITTVPDNKTYFGYKQLNDLWYFLDEKGEWKSCTKDMAQSKSNSLHK